MESKGCLLMSLQDLERIKLLEKIKSKKITQVEAARLLDLSERQVIRLCQEYKKLGAAGIISKHRGKLSNNRLKEDFKDKVAATIREHYSDFKPTFAHEKLFENHNLDLSVESVRQIMIAHGLWAGETAQDCCLSDAPKALAIWRGEKSGSCDCAQDDGLGCAG